MLFFLGKFLVVADVKLSQTLTCLFASKKRTSLLQARGCFTLHCKCILFTLGPKPLSRKKWGSYCPQRNPPIWNRSADPEICLGLAGYQLPVAPF